MPRVFITKMEVNMVGYSELIKKFKPREIMEEGKYA